jgi:hypothetical protein
MDLAILQYYIDDVELVTWECGLGNVELTIGQRALRKVDSTNCKINMTK